MFAFFRLRLFYFVFLYSLLLVFFFVFVLSRLCVRHYFLVQLIQLLIFYSLIINYLVRL